MTTALQNLSPEKKRLLRIALSEIAKKNKSSVLLSELNLLEKELTGIIEKAISIKKGEQGVRGEKGDRGERGKEGQIGQDGRNADEKKIIKKVLKKIPKPKDGKDGRPADETKIISQLLKKMPEPLEPETPEQIRDKLETLKEEERLKSEAIDGLEDKFKELEEKIDKLPKFGGGGVSDLAVKFSLGRLVKSETPTGTINGTNKIFTVTGDIFAILHFGINGMVIHDSEYTTSGKTITFTTALPAALSGTSFRIVYV